MDDNKEDETDFIPVGLDIDAHNQWVEELQADIEFEPLRDFLELLKE